MKMCGDIFNEETYENAYARVEQWLSTNKCSSMYDHVFSCDSLLDENNQLKTVRRNAGKLEHLIKVVASNIEYFKFSPRSRARFIISEGCETLRDSVPLRNADIAGLRKLFAKHNTINAEYAAFLPKSPTDTLLLEKQKSKLKSYWTTTA